MAKEIEDVTKKIDEVERDLEHAMKGGDKEEIRYWRRKEEQLRREKEQLREEKLKLLELQTQGSSAGMLCSGD